MSSLGGDDAEAVDSAPNPPPDPSPLTLPVDLTANVARARLQRVAARAVYIGPALKPWSRAYAGAIAAQPEFQPGTWPELTLDQRREAIQHLENLIASAQDREPATIITLPDSAPKSFLRHTTDFILETGRWLLDGPRWLAGLPPLAREDFGTVGVYQPGDLTISISESELADDSPIPVLDTFTHEDRHALQDASPDAPRRWAWNNEHYADTWDHGTHALVLTTLGAVTTAFLAPAAVIPLAVTGAAIAVVSVASNLAYRFQPIERNAFTVGNTVAQTLSRTLSRTLAQTLD
jgi:hypothetical protein